MLGAVEEIYLKFMGDTQNLSEEEFLKELKSLLNGTSKHTYHVNLFRRDKNKVIFETSKYIQGKGEYFDHKLWMFTKSTEGKYTWTLNRYSIGL